MQPDPVAGADPLDLIAPNIPAPLAAALRAAAARHDHLCPRQVLGARIGLLGLRQLGLEGARTDKRLLAIVESDGCFCDGVTAATGCDIGHRTLRAEDYGKIAATLVDSETSRAIRIRPRLDARALAAAHTPDADSRWHAYVRAYQTLPDEALLDVEDVALVVPVSRLISHPKHRALCADCGEEVSNERELVVDGLVLCRPCAARRAVVDAGAGVGMYYRPAGPARRGLNRGD